MDHEQNPAQVPTRQHAVGCCEYDDASLALAALFQTGQLPTVKEVAGINEYHAGNHEAAIELIESAMLEVRLAHVSQMVLARCWIATGNLESAATTVEFLVEMVERIPCCLMPELTRLASSIQRNDLALDLCRESCARHPADSNAVFGAAYYMHQLGYPLRLVKRMTAHALSLAPDCALYRINLASICCSLNQWDEAYQHIDLVPDKALTHIPCQCIRKQLTQLFRRFNDQAGLELLQRGQS